MQDSLTDDKAADHASRARRAAAILAASRELIGEAEIDGGLRRMTWEIRAALGERFPLVLGILGGPGVFAGMLLPRLDFPLEFDHLHLAGYQDGDGMRWRVSTQAAVAGRTVLVVDELLDDGRTMAAISRRLRELGAADVRCAVLCERASPAAKPARPDICGFSVPASGHVFGCGMDVEGLWRNLPTVRILD